MRTGASARNGSLHVHSSIERALIERCGSARKIPCERFDEVFPDEATVRVQIAPTFFGWLAQFGSQMKVMEPEGVAKQYFSHILKTAETVNNGKEEGSGT